MASSSNLELKEALDILENIHVEMIRELNSEVSAIVNHSETGKYINPLTLAMEIEKAIKAISFATDLNTEEITTIFSLRPGASLEDVSYRLHRQSAHDRFSF
jgi:sugar phosphate isomerase/epimerase